MKMKVRIKNLRARTIIGIHEWEKELPREVLINLTMEFFGDAAVESDRIDDTVNYRIVKKKILKAVENSKFELLEKLAAYVLRIVMEDQRIKSAIVEIDKPNALRFTDSVSVECSASRD